MHSQDFEQKSLAMIEACAGKRDFEKVLYELSNDPENPNVYRRKLSRADCKMIVNKLWEIGRNEAKAEHEQRQYGLWKACAGWANALLGKA